MLPRRQRATTSAAGVEPDRAHATASIASAALDDFDVETGGDAARAPAASPAWAHHRELFPRQAGDADEGAGARHPRAASSSAVFNDEAVARRGPPRGAAVGAQAAIVGGRDRDQEGRRARASSGARSMPPAIGGRICVLEQFVPGDVYHVDSIVWEGRSCSRWRSSTAGRRWRSRTRAASSSRGGCRTSPRKGGRSRR